MKGIFGKTAMWLFVTVAVAAVAFAAGQSLPEGDGKKIVEDVCASCHSLDPIRQQQLDKDGWKDLVVKMQGYGAPLDEKQVATVTDYLTKNFGPKAAAGGGGGGAASNASDEEAKKLIEGICASCHDSGLVTGTTNTKEGWQETVQSMNAKGAGLSEKDVEMLVNYLARTYPQK
jgi:cytochrome c5